jgi:hypothetical protein
MGRAVPVYYLSLFGIEGNRLDEVLIVERIDGVEVAGQTVYLYRYCLCFLELFF